MSEREQAGETESPEGRLTDGFETIRLLAEHGLLSRDECLERLETLALGEGQEDPQVWRLLGIYYGEDGWMDGAEAAFQRAFALDPTDPVASYGLALVRAETGEWEEAARLADLAIDRYTQLLQAWEQACPDSAPERDIQIKGLRLELGYAHLLRARALWHLGRKGPTMGQLFMAVSLVPQEAFRQLTEGWAPERWVRLLLRQQEEARALEQELRETGLKGQVDEAAQGLMDALNHGEWRAMVQAARALEHLGGRLVNPGVLRWAAMAWLWIAFHVRGTGRETFAWKQAERLQAQLKARDAWP